MEYVCVEARFKFFDGKKRFTVEFSFGLSMWFVFPEDGQSNALFTKDQRGGKSPNREMASHILDEYFETIKPIAQPIK